VIHYGHDSNHFKTVSIFTAERSIVEVLHADEQFIEKLRLLSIASRLEAVDLIQPDELMEHHIVYSSHEYNV